MKGSKLGKKRRSTTLFFVPHQKRDTYDAANRTEIDRSDNNVFLGDLGPGACRIRPPSYKSLPLPVPLSIVAQTSQRLSWKTGRVSDLFYVFIFFATAGPLLRLATTQVPARRLSHFPVLSG